MRWRIHQRAERLPVDGDALAFGDPELLYFLTESLHAQLAGAGLAKG